MKRRRSEDVDSSTSADSTRGNPKRIRLSHRNLLDLSDELLLRILGFLEVRHLVATERTSRHLQELSRDSELWKALFYSEWIAPRARRIPSSIRPSPAKLLKWLEHGEMLRDGAKIDWKRQYKIRNNWDRGDARLHEIEVAKPPTPPVLAKVHKGFVFTVDALSGLRVWSQDRKLQSPTSQFHLDNIRPTALAVDESSSDLMVAVGFEDGSFKLFRFSRPRMHLDSVLDYPVAKDTSLVSMALSMPYLVVMTSNRHIYLYELRHDPSAEQQWSPRSLAVLHADSPLHPAALSVRSTPHGVIATIAYAFSRLNDGWCLGLQEIRSTKNAILSSRTASTVETPLEAKYRGMEGWDVSSRSAFSTPLTTPFVLNPQLHSPPTSLSYSHPFLLASLCDNTIMSYIVQSDDEKLTITNGKRLWGHTSAVSFSEVSNRGKAVSVSARGDEIRVWELEEMLTTIGRVGAGTAVKPFRNAAFDIADAVAKRGNGLGLALSELRQEYALTRHWVGFDDEQVVVMGERDEKQIMACYDFTT